MWRSLDPESLAELSWGSRLIIQIEEQRFPQIPLGKGSFFAKTRLSPNAPAFPISWCLQWQLYKRLQRLKNPGKHPQVKSNPGSIWIVILWPGSEIWLVLLKIHRSHTIFQKIHPRAGCSPTSPGHAGSAVTRTVLLQELWFNLSIPLGEYRASAGVIPLQPNLSPN